MPLGLSGSMKIGFLREPTPLSYEKEMMQTTDTAI
jgi:hypothetical protein